MKNIVAIVQARMGSKRLPGKVMRSVNGEILIDLLIARLSKAKSLKKILFATTNSHEDDVLVKHLLNRDIEVYRGSVTDVLDRYYKAAESVNADIIVRITGDCPLVDPQLVDQMVSQFTAEDVDYLSNTLVPTYPDGLDVEIFTFEALCLAQENAENLYQREHVTPYIKSEDIFTKSNFGSENDFSYLRWTVDEAIDLAVLSEIAALFDGRTDFAWTEVIKHPKFSDISISNSHLRRDEGANMSDAQKLWKRAKFVIPGGNMLLSKRPEMFLPEKWPTYFSKASGCEVWDIDNNKYIDTSIMGIGTNLLGYGQADVDAAVMKTISNGNMSTLNCPEEVYLAEKLIELHPWAEMVRFARTGGEANAVAVRIARAASGKSGVAICGYHGWHDWYLATNLSSTSALSDHLLPGLDTCGVPNQLGDSVHPFRYNDYEKLKNLVEEKNIGVIVMEVMRNHSPQQGFLDKVRQLASKKGIILIFDECTSGFRETNGGLHKKFGVEPDMAMFGKALGNGYAITAVIGRREVMEYAQSSFISSTFWTERIGPTAALSTLNVMKEIGSWDTVTNIGKKILKNWSDIASKNEIKISLSGIPALASFSFQQDNLIRKTYFIQEMLKRGYLASNSFYASIAHTDSILDNYFTEMDLVFASMHRHIENDSLLAALEGPVCHSGFKRLN